MEASDLAGMRKSEVEHLKATLSRQVDGPVRMAYGRLPLERPRSFIVIGTTNSNAYLKDMTGNRRFWPVTVHEFDTERLKKDRDQLWAEAAHREGAGESIRLDPKFYDELQAVQEERLISDPFYDKLRDSDIDWNQEKIPNQSILAVLEITNIHDPRIGERLYPIMAIFKHPLKKFVRFDGKPQLCWLREDLITQFELSGEDTRPDYVKELKH